MFAKRSFIGESKATGGMVTSKGRPLEGGHLGRAAFQRQKLVANALFGSDLTGYNMLKTHTPRCHTHTQQHPIPERER